MENKLKNLVESLSALMIDTELTDDITFNQTRNGHMAKIKVDQSNLGIFVNIISDAYVTVSFNDEMTYANISLDYEHIHGGQNGYNFLRAEFDDEMNIIKHRFGN
jgi:hypothetical protein